MKIIFVFIIAFIAYGSLYPFNFNCQLSTDESFTQLNNTWTTVTSRGDILANIVLFLPFGYTGILAISKQHNKFIFYFIILLIFGTIFSISLQILQICLPSRDPSLYDAVLNFVGTVIGAITGLIHHNYVLSKETRFKNLFTTPLLLIVSWFCYRLLPFIPSIDLQDIKNSIKPLFINVEFSWVNVIHDAIAWIVVWYLWTNSSARYTAIKYLVFSMIMTFALEILIIENTITLSNIAGAITAVIVWSLIKNFQFIIPIIIVALTFSLLCSGLYPFEFSSVPLSFHWLPFYGFLQGSMQLNTSVIFEKFFFYGTLLWFLNQYTHKWSIAVSYVFIVTTFIEVLQLFSFTHVSEITDPLLVLVFALFLKVSNKSQSTFKEVNKNPIIANNIYDIRIIPKSHSLLEQLPAEGVYIERFPFQIGRHSENKESRILENKIILLDQEPFHLSKSHLTIDIDKNNSLVLHDTSSLGTIVNGIKIGGGNKLKSQPLKIGNNEVVIDEKKSDFIFNIIVSIKKQSK